MSQGKGNDVKRILKLACIIKSVEAMNANNIVKSFYFTNRCEVIEVMRGKKHV